MSLMAYVDKCMQTLKIDAHNHDDDINECIEERAAIMEIDGGLQPDEAERQAKVICLAQYRARRLKPDGS